jgi:NADH-quinone oxidoreductase subunit M
MELPLLSIIVFSPAVGALIIMALPKHRHNDIKLVAAIASAISCLGSIYAFFTYDTAAGGIQFEEQFAWIPAIGTSYHVGVDGISLPLVLLTGVIIFAGVLVSWVREQRPREFFALLLLLVTGVFGTFVALDLFLLFVFYELAVLPMYLLIGIWGTTRKEYAAMKLTLYLLIGSSIALAGVIVAYVDAGLGTFDLLKLAEAGFEPGLQTLLFLPIFVGFDVLGGLWPFHTWSPDGHVAAPTAVSMLHAGVLMKMGAYSALRVGVLLLPDAAQVWLPWIVILTVINVVYGATVAFAQRDFKYVIGYSSVSHMGYVTMGVATICALGSSPEGAQLGLSGAVMQMFSHGVMTGIFFAVVGLIYRRTHTRQLPELGGLARKLPLVAAAFIIAGLSSMGMPGLSGFVAEFQVLMGTYKAFPLVAILSLIGVVVTAAYILRFTYMVFFGPLKEEFRGLPPISAAEKFALAFMCIFIVGFGIAPGYILQIIHTGVSEFLAAIQ